MAEPKELKVKEQQTTFVKGEHSNDAVVVTSPKTTVVNLPYVEDVKEIAKANAGSGSGGESEWEQQIKDKLIYNETDEQVECGTDLEVDGKVKINNLQQITDTDGDPIIPDPTGHVGEVLYHTTTGYGWKADTGTRLYLHTVVADGSTIMRFLSLSDNALGLEMGSFAHMDDIFGLGLFPVLHGAYDESQITFYDYANSNAGNIRLKQLGGTTITISASGITTLTDTVVEK